MKAQGTSKGPMWSEWTVPGVGMDSSQGVVGEDRKSEFYLKGFKKPQESIKLIRVLS